MFYSTRVIIFIFLLAGGASARIITRAQADRGSISLNGHKYRLKPLSDAIQGAHSNTYDILGGFVPQRRKEPRVPAILKVISHSSDSEEVKKIKKEIEYLRKVRLHLFSRNDRKEVYIVMRNVRKRVPPLKPYHEWYLEDRSRNLDKDLKDLQENIEKKLIAYTGPGWDLCYTDIQFLNIFVDKTLETVMPIDWGVGDYVWGVKELADEDDIEECKEYLSEVIPNRLGCKELVYALKLSNNTLWPLDRELSICTGKDGELEEDNEEQEE